jgi:hypothetical protein
MQLDLFHVEFKWNIEMGVKQTRLSLNAGLMHMKWTVKVTQYK